MSMCVYVSKLSVVCEVGSKSIARDSLMQRSMKRLLPLQLHTKPNSYPHPHPPTHTRSHIHKGGQIGCLILSARLGEPQRGSALAGEALVGALRLNITF